MREVESESRMRPLIAGRLCQQTSRQRFVSTRPQIWLQSVEISINCSNPSVPLCAFRPPRSIFVVSFPIFIPLIATIIGCVFDLESRDFGGFDVDNNVLNNEANSNRIRKNGLRNNDCYFCDVLSSPVNDTIGADTCPTGVGLGQTIENEYDFNAVSTVTAIVTIVQNENNSKPSGPYTHIRTQTQQQHTVAPAIDSNDKTSRTGVRLRDFDSIGCIFNGIIDDNELEYDISSGMCILCFVLF